MGASPWSQLASPCSHAGDKLGRRPRGKSLTYKQEGSVNTDPIQCSFLAEVPWGEPKTAIRPLCDERGNSPTPSGDDQSMRVACVAPPLVVLQPKAQCHRTPLSTKKIRDVRVRAYILRDM